MAHTDIHAKTEASIAKARAARQSTYDDVKKEGPAKPSTPDETQELRDCPKYSTAYKGSLTRSEIYERLMPDNKTGALRIDGPIIPGAPGGGAFMSFLSDGGIVIRTGKKSEEAGPSSGLLCIHTEGQQQKHLGKSVIQYNEGGTEGEGEALNIIAYGDVTENAAGSQRTIKAQKILIKATEEIFFESGSQIVMQAGDDGGGTISLIAGTVETVADNLKEVIVGQRMTFGAGEEQKTQFDPRANVVINSPGHLNSNVLGTYNVKVGGLVDVFGGAAVNLTGVGNVNIKGALILLN